MEPPLIGAYIASPNITAKKSFHSRNHSSGLPLTQTLSREREKIFGAGKESA
jgi:hypothetical protein